MQEHARALAERGDATEALRLRGLLLVEIMTDRKHDKCGVTHSEATVLKDVSGAWGSPASEELGALRFAAIR